MRAGSGQPPTGPGTHHSPPPLLGPSPPGCPHDGSQGSRSPRPGVHAEGAPARAAPLGPSLGLSLIRPWPS